MDDLKRVEELKQAFEAELQSGQVPTGRLLKDRRLKELFQTLRDCPSERREELGKALNELKEFLAAQDGGKAEAPLRSAGAYLDVTAPWDLGQDAPPRLPEPENGSIHPILAAQADIVGIFARMGFEALESRQLDSAFYMFDSLNFPPRHPARDTFDNFLLAEKDTAGQPLLAPASYFDDAESGLEEPEDYASGEWLADSRCRSRPGFQKRRRRRPARPYFLPIGRHLCRPGRLGRQPNRHFERGDVGVLRPKVSLKIQPSYFPFTEPSLEFAVSCPFCADDVCHVCGGSQWIELIGCGMIHPNVLKIADIDTETYTGFAWGLGLNRLAMIKHNIEDIRHFTSGKLEFLRQFKS